MLINGLTQIRFTGWEANDLLKGKLNNEKELNALSDEAKVSLRTSKSKENKYLPGHDIYITTASKKVGFFHYYATDCLITTKGTSNDELSKDIFESAEKSIGKLYGKLAQLKVIGNEDVNNIAHSSVSKKSNNFLKKLLQMFRK